jgi:hypothetical protein
MATGRTLQNKAIVVTPQITTKTNQSQTSPTETLYRAVPRVLSVTGAPLLRQFRKESDFKTIIFIRQKAKTS